MAESRNKRRGTFSRNQLTDEIILLLKHNPNKLFTAKGVFRAFGNAVDKDDKHFIAELLQDLAAKGSVDVVDGEYYSFSMSSFPKLKGRLVSIINAGGFVSIDDMDSDVIVSRENLGNALLDDLVEVAVFPSRKKDRLEGIVTTIIERANKKYVGVLEIGKGHAFVVPDNREMPYDIFIPQKELKPDMVDNDKVTVEITEFPAGAKNPIGHIIKRLGQAGDHNTEMHAILEEFDLPYEFSDEVIKASEAIPLDIPEAEIARRRDMRGITTFTIDPFDAKDFDDALSIERLGEDLWEVGIHIADVSHYITPGSTLDTEALRRATSVYLVDRVVPMLPERLSNGVCSLRPNEDKLCFSAVFKLNSEAEVKEHWFGRTVINSDRRFAYEEAQQVIEGFSDEMKEEILTLDTMAKKMRQRRFDAGSIAFDRDEPKFVLDDEGKPIKVYFKEMKDSNHLIEEFMLLANRNVAEYVAKLNKSGKPKTFVYRIHDKPSGEKIQELSRFTAKFGYAIKAKNDKMIAKEISNLLNSVKGKSVENLFTILAIRSMAKAIYSTENIGHYGLCFDYYTHFTSPIRRYPDVMAHRLLQRYLDGKRSANQEEYEELCQHSSARESLAAEAERASVKYKMVEFMADKIGEEFEGTVSGITEWGVYIELKHNRIEGMVSVREMIDDIYYFDKENYSYVGSRKGHVYRLGDDVLIRVLRIDLVRKVIDFEFVIPDQVSILDLKDSSHTIGENKKYGNSRGYNSGGRQNGRGGNGGGRQGGKGASRSSRKRK